MASSSPTDSLDMSNLNCAMCHDIYQNPKFLPCYHTFCTPCIQTWADRYQGKATFPCPICRQETSLPPEGVAAFQTNFYLSDDDLERARNKKLCMVHNKKELEFFCVHCDKAICLSCKLTDHESHETQDLAKAAELKKKGLNTERLRLQNAATDLTQRVEAVKKEQQILPDRKMKVERAIHARHAMLIAIADRFRDQELSSLHAQTSRQESGLAEDLDRLLKKLGEVRKLDHEVEQCVHSGTTCELLRMAEEMKDGSGSLRCMAELMSLETSEVFYPHLRSSVNVDAISEHIRLFMGSVEKAGRNTGLNDVTVVMGRFRCGIETDIEIYSLCPDTDCRVRVSYARRAGQEDACNEEFHENGKLLSTVKQVTGKMWKRCGNGEAIYVSSAEGWLNTFNKSHTETHLKLSNNLSGQADIWRVTVTSEDPFKTEATKEVSLKMGAHRAHDVDASRQLFALVEEGQAPDQQRKVRMFRLPPKDSVAIFRWVFKRPQKDAVATYSPATLTFQPSDVCFYKLDGQHVLLVADELGDSIHVVNVQDDTMNFVRYLAPDCPLLVQPTALNVDHKGRLWVACRGGYIFTIEPNI